MKNDCPLQAICLQETWFSPETDLSLYIIPGYHMISTGRYASNHGGLVIYLNKKWEYKLTRCTRGDARSFFCTYKMYLYAQNYFLKNVFKYCFKSYIKLHEYAN